MGCVQEDGKLLPAASAVRRGTSPGEPEAETGALYLEKPEDVRRYSLILDYLRAQALGPAESRALIEQMAGETLG